MAATARPNQVQPSVDAFITDGQKLVFGDTAVTAVSLPVTLPVVVSFIIPVKDKGVQHMAALLGGNGLPALPVNRHRQACIRSAQHGYLHKLS